MELCVWRTDRFRPERNLIARGLGEIVYCRLRQSFSGKPGGPISSWQARNLAKPQWLRDQQKVKGRLGTFGMSNEPGPGNE
jgi:hypothetical protein